MVSVVKVMPDFTLGSVNVSKVAGLFLRPIGLKNSLFLGICTMLWVKRGLFLISMGLKIADSFFPPLEILTLEKWLFLVGWLRVMGIG